MSPFGSFFIIHCEVGGDTQNLRHQEVFWPVLSDLVNMSDQYGASLSIQLNPQWAEYILMDEDRFGRLKKWQQDGHEIGLHHHGYDHEDWDGYTNRDEGKRDSKFRGSVRDAVSLMTRLVYPLRLLSGTISDEEFDYPEGIQYDTEGIRYMHSRSRPKQVDLGGNQLIQVGMALLSKSVDIENLQKEYFKSKGDEIFGIVTHEKNFAESPDLIEEWLRFIKNNKGCIKTVSKIIEDYKLVYPIRKNSTPLTFGNDVSGSASVKAVADHEKNE